MLFSNNESYNIVEYMEQTWKTTPCLLYSAPKRNAVSHTITGMQNIQYTSDTSSNSLINELDREFCYIINLSEAIQYRI